MQAGRVGGRRFPRRVQRWRLGRRDGAGACNDPHVELRPVSPACAADVGQEALDDRLPRLRVDALHHSFVCALRAQRMQLRRLLARPLRQADRQLRQLARLAVDALEQPLVELAHAVAHHRDVGDDCPGLPHLVGQLRHGQDRRDAQRRVRRIEDGLQPLGRRLLALLSQ
eukprot:3138901-Prymnesium_polylepis.1